MTITYIVKKLLGIMQILMQC